MSTATSETRRLWSRRGFTLIEVIGAVAAFVIAFLAGSAAFARLLQQQSTSYHRTLAASAAMLLVDRHVDAITPGSGDFAAKNADILDTISPVSNLQFQGDDYKAGDDVYMFKTAAGGYTADELKSYRPLVLTVSADDAPETDSAIRWRQLSVWQGNPELVAANKPATLHFLTRFLIPYQYK